MKTSELKKEIRDRLDPHFDAFLQEDEREIITTTIIDRIYEEGKREGREKAISYIKDEINDGVVRDTEHFLAHLNKSMEQARQQGDLPNEITS